MPWLFKRRRYGINGLWLSMKIGKSFCWPVRTICITGSMIKLQGGRDNPAIMEGWKHVSNGVINGISKPKPSGYTSVSDLSWLFCLLRMASSRGGFVHKKCASVVHSPMALFSLNPLENSQKIAFFGDFRYPIFRHRDLRWFRVVSWNTTVGSERGSRNG